jgi:hypothetical protein
MFERLDCQGIRARVRRMKTHHGRAAVRHHVNVLEDPVSPNGEVESDEKNAGNAPTDREMANHNTPEHPCSEVSVRDVRVLMVV